MKTMTRNELKALYKDISQCACVGKGESDTRNNHSRFKIICGVNIKLLDRYFERLNKSVSAIALDMVSPLMNDFYEKQALVKDDAVDAEAQIKALGVEYKEAIDSFNAFELWLDEYMKEDVEIPFLNLWNFDDLPELISGGYMLSIRAMVKDFPEDYELK